MLIKMDLFNLHAFYLLHLESLSSSFVKGALSEREPIQAESRDMSYKLKPTQPPVAYTLKVCRTHSMHQKLIETSNYSVLNPRIFLDSIQKIKLTTGLKSTGVTLQRQKCYVSNADVICSKFSDEINCPIVFSIARAK